MEHINSDARDDQTSNVESGDVEPISPTQETITGVSSDTQVATIIEYSEWAILDFLIRRKRQVTVKQVHANVSGYSEFAIKSWLITLSMKDMIKVIEGDGDIKYVVALRGFNAWNDYPRR